MKRAFLFLMFIFGVAAQGPTHYLFAQQVNDMCAMAPMMNLERLEELKAARLKLGPQDFYTRRQWFIINSPPLIAWHKAFESINMPEGKKAYPHLAQYLEGAVRYGIVYPHLYDAHGNSVLSDHLKKAVMEAFMTPYFFLDYDWLVHKQFKLLGLIEVFTGADLRPGLGLWVPVGKDAQPVAPDNPYVIGFLGKKDGRLAPEFQSFTRESKDAAWYDLKAFTPPNYLGLNTLDLIYNIQLNPSMLGFSELGKALGIARGYKTEGIKAVGWQGNFESGTMIPYSLGLYTLILRAVGITDLVTSFEDKVTSNSDEKLAAIMQGAVEDLQRLREQDEKNPWHSKRLSQDKLLQHAFAEIFKEDKELFALFKMTSNFYFKLWEIYSGTLEQIAHGKLFGPGKHQYRIDEVKYYMPSEEYTMAFAVAQNAWLLWLGALNPEAFYKSVNEEGSRYQAWALGIIWDWFKHNAYKKLTVEYEGRVHEVSFMDCWQRLVGELHKKFQRKDWISFNGHGCVMSFDNRVINLQKRQPGMHDKKLLDDLRMTVIDSWLGKYLPVFYKR